MKALVVLLLLAFALADGLPQGRKEKRRQKLTKPEERPDIKWQFEDWTVKTRPRNRKPWKMPREGMNPHRGQDGPKEDTPHVRWCVTNPCEMKKCKRMITEFNYMVSPRLRWSCVMASCKKSCMDEIRLGHADIMTAEGEDIYTAGKMHDLIPIMYEKENHQGIPDYDTKFAMYEEPDGSFKHFSIVLVKKTNRDVNSFQDMDQRKSCHPGVDTTFKAPICSLIQKRVIPRAGNVYECAGEFFKESCVPGVQNYKYNWNMTNPESLCKLCQGPEDDDFCETLSDKEPYYGFTGTLECLRDGAGDVAFVHTHDVMANYDALYNEFDIVCKDNRLTLDWANVKKTDCHLTEEHPQVLMVSSDKPKDWVKVCTNALTDASTRFSTPGSVNAFSLFDSSAYCAKGDEGDSQDEQGEEDGEGYRWEMTWMKNKDLIFKDSSSSLVTIPENETTYKQFLGDETAIWKTCAELEPKPRAFICVVGDEEMKKCKNMISNFQKVTDVKKISWGCIEAMSKKDCVEMVAKNVADIVDLNAMDMFMAGLDYNLAPFMAENYKGKDPMTESITIGVMRKNGGDLPEDMRGWNMCNAGVHKISGFLHPMGWLLANGTIPRSSSPLKSIGHHFGESCVPGMYTLDLTKHPMLSRTLDWYSMLKDKVVRWEEWYQTPEWLKWQDKQDSISDEYQPMHDMQNFESPEFPMLIKKMTTENPRAHAHHTQEMHDVIEKTKKDFSWDNYDGLEDFYDLTMPKWKLISWVWQKPEDWTEEEWNLFDMWAEQQWDQKEDWTSYTDKWTVKDWETFKNWMDTEYKEYTTDHTPMHQDTFIRLSLLCSRHHWLMDQWKNLQWDNLDMNHCRDRMCEACAGQGDEKCSMDPISEEYYDYEGALKCLKREDGDVAFIDAYTLDDAITNNGYTRDDFILMCPDGKTVDYTGTDSFQECNFGRVPSHALVTCNMHDGIWRWKVTKALLEAQKVLTPQEMYQDGIFNKDVESLTPIPFVNQTYQVWLGPKFLRAMEGLMQPPVKESKVDPECEGEECDEDPEDRPACDECLDDDTLCMENCWSVEPSENKPTKEKKKPKSQGKHHRQIGGRNNQRGRGRNRVSHRKPTKMMRKMKKNMLWKPKGRKMHQMMGKKHMRFMKPGIMNMGPMKRMKQKMPRMMHPGNGKGPMMHSMEQKMPSRMYPGNSKGPMMHSIKQKMPHVMHPGNAKGPMVHSMEQKMPRMMHPGNAEGPMMHSMEQKMPGRMYPGNSKGPMMHGMEQKMPGRMYPGNSKGPMMHSMEQKMPRMMHPGNAKGPMMHSMEQKMPGRMYPGNSKGPMMHGMEQKMPRMMHPGNSKGPMMHSMEQKMPGMKYGVDYMMSKPMSKPMRGHTMVNRHMENGPVLHSHRSLRSEFYTKVIFVRDGTCNAIIQEISCFGERRNFRMRAGRVGKTFISVPMCHKPNIMENTTAQFTCNNGASFLKPVLLPLTCSYVPCNPGFWLPDWSKDQYWEGDNSYPGDYWGTNRDNWFLANRNQNRVEKTKTWRKGGL
ncbi:hypothetical protein ACROYT_G002322 [Oculina patagonica]